MSEDSPTRGRPRPQTTVDRDNRIYALLEKAGPQTRNAIADEINLTPQLAYLSLSRLRERNLVRRCLDDSGRTVWTTKVDEACP